jgi:hypothetical protein
VKAPGPEPSAPPEACPTSSATSRPQRVAIDGWNCRMGHGMPWDVMGCHGIFFFFAGVGLGNVLHARRKMRLKLKRTLAGSAFAGL